MTIKDIIEKLEGDMKRNKENMVEHSSSATRYFYISDLLDCIKSNLDEDKGVEILEDYRGWSFYADIEIRPLELRVILQDIHAYNYERLKCPLKIEDIEGNSSQAVRKKLEEHIDNFESKFLSEKEKKSGAE